jgi:O-antigen ligase
LFVVAGTVITWKHVKSMLNLFAGAAFLVLAAAKFVAKPGSDGRLALDMGFDGTISNPNDLAAHILLLLPFLLLLVIKPGVNKILKALSFCAMFYGLWVILGAASRGAMVGLFAIALFLFFKAGGSQRIAVLVTVPLLAVILVAILPHRNLERLATVFGSEQVVEEGQESEAGESMASRTYLLEQSIKYTIEHPLVGIGPDQFPNFEGKTARALGQHGNWHVTHNSYTQVSSECGIPALIFMLAGLGASFGLVNRTYKKARAQNNKEIAQTCLCYLASLTGYAVTITFLSCAYRFTLPALVGVAIAIHFAAERELMAGAVPLQTARTAA